VSAAIHLVRRRRHMRHGSPDRVGAMAPVTGAMAPVTDGMAPCNGGMAPCYGGMAPVNGGTDTGSGVAAGAGEVA
jgi:hypothetical protein